MDDLMAVMPARHSLVKAMTIVTVMVVMAAVGLNDDRSSVRRNCSCGKGSKGESRSDKELVHGIPPVGLLALSNVVQRRWFRAYAGELNPE
jgi:hypothetical protein